MWADLDNKIFNIFKDDPWFVWWGDHHGAGTKLLGFHKLPLLSYCKFGVQAVQQSALTALYGTKGKGINTIQKDQKIGPTMYSFWSRHARSHSSSSSNAGALMDKPNAPSCKLFAASGQHIFQYYYMVESDVLKRCYVIFVVLVSYEQAKKHAILPSATGYNPLITSIKSVF